MLFNLILCQNEIWRAPYTYIILHQLRIFAVELMKIKIIDTIWASLYRQSYHICSARLPDENTEFANDTDKIKTLSPCFDAGCDYRKDEE